AEAYYEGRPVGKAEAQCNHGCAKVQIELSEKHLWEVGCGRLYDLKLSFCGDEVTSYFGLRNVCLDGYKFRINGKSVFQRLVLDQGFYPDGIYTAPTDEALLNDILISKAVGFNGARLHEKIFEPRFLYHCDREGYIVWGEYPNWGLDHSRPEAVFSILPEWIEELRRDFNHPSIIGWCPFNETWDVKGRKQCDEILSLVYHTTKAIDPTRPCIDTSGNYHVVTDIFDLHDYDQSPESYKKKFGSFGKDQPPHDNHAKRQTYRGEPLFISEYGGIRWSDDANSWGYGDTPKSEEEFIARYKGLTDVLLDNENIFGFCYTQLYDIEQEQNGLYTYDRKPKFDPAIFKAINERKAAIED
ncbi:MAG TPA: glycoside hydrolase family 2 TIM barrel-domain containing protein, partial [Clostridiales bacterium]|nr:glycoside hydrolase family 2 TIM barrel-domain containing protein [Clostridiales bacterium]